MKTKVIKDRLRQNEGIHVSFDVSEEQSVQEWGECLTELISGGCE